LAPRGGRISDHGNRYGLLSLADVVVHSSNIGMAKVGEMLGNKNLYAVAQRFGLDCPTGLELPGECGGILRKLEKWDGYSLRRIPFGQEISITALQLTMAFCSFANGGLLVRPRLIEAVRDPAGNEIYNSHVQVVRRVLSPQVATQSMLILQDVVERGTAKSAKSQLYTIFGKTGTAQIPGPGGYVPNAYVSTFVGGAPVSSPRLVCAISVYWPDTAKGYYGGKVAAPFVKNVLEQALSYLDVPPDRQGDTRRNTTRTDDGGRGGW
ncbi:MAG: penicillin-binding protein 2, partial [Planctomycetes bacterium]|nr:penicillin-binding protein 2 [Planctomycetota bacterium]